MNAWEFEQHEVLRFGVEDNKFIDKIHLNKEDNSTRCNSPQNVYIEYTVHNT